ncbi:glutathione S-transferase [Alteromonadaceae bacterium Bs31]|nr:glutathione S-transferase [Alteromonadaceae bacterium Bs31]
MSTINFYRHPLSGHAHRVELLLSILGVNANTIDIDLMKGEQKQPEFLAKNPFGQVPVLEDQGLYISDSNAILVYLASKYDHKREWLPNNPKDAAAVQQFLSIAASAIATGPATARLITLFGANYDAASTIEKSHNILAHFERHLSERNWLATDHPSIADLANYAYIARAPEGKVSLEAYPEVRAWLSRVEALKGFVPMTKSPVGLAA